MSSVEITLDTKESKFEVQMGIWTDDSFTAAVANDFTVQVPDKLYISAALVGGESAMVIQGRKCWATPRYNCISRNRQGINFNFSSDPTDAAQYVFINNFCSTESDTSVLEVYQNGIAQMFQFGLASFLFSDEPAAQIFLHCEVRICDPAVETCQLPCDGSGNRRRRSVDNNLASMKIGPIHVVQ